MPYNKLRANDFPAQTICPLYYSSENRSNFEGYASGSRYRVNYIHW